jgi:hypothetical protein
MRWAEPRSSQITVICDVGISHIRVMSLNAWTDEGTSQITVIWDTCSSTCLTFNYKVRHACLIEDALSDDSSIFIGGGPEIFNKHCYFSLSRVLPSTHFQFLSPHCWKKSPTEFSFPFSPIAECSFPVAERGVHQVIGEAGARRPSAGTRHFSTSGRTMHRSLNSYRCSMRLVLWP